MTIEKIKVLYGFTNCYVIADEQSGECAVVDPGANAEKIEKYIDYNGLSLKYILLTHGHYDHTGAVFALCESFPETVVYLSSAEKIISNDKKITKLFPPVINAVDVSENTVIWLGGIEISVLETPGHSKGSVCYIAGDCIFSGDTLFASNIGRTDMYGGSEEQIRLSLEKLCSLNGNYRVFPGHMNETELEKERMTNPYLKSFAKK